MEKIEFTKIHNVIIDFLKEENNDELEMIGSWYFCFLKSEEEKISLYLPNYSNELLRLAYNYIRAFTIVFNLLKEKELTDFESACLFDIFNHSSKTPMHELTLDYIKQNEGLILWGEDTLTKLDAFLPVFEKEEVLRFNKPKTIINTFELYKSIRNSGIIDFPQHIDIEEKTLVFNNLDNVSNDFISENLLLVDNALDDDSAMELEEQLINQKLHHSLIVKYPYSKKPHPYLIDTAKKKFKLVFNNRFAYNDILENDIFLLKDETKLKSNLEYNVINTGHNKELYDLFKSFKGQWIDLEFNKFTTPFPKYWLLFLNDSLTKEQWLNQFKKDFPAVAEKPIIKIVEQIIEELLKLNWIEKVITDSTKILFPELKSNRKKRLEFVFNNFKNHVNFLNSSVEFIDTMDFEVSENIIVLDSFNKIDLVNKSQSSESKKVNVVVPDFLYYGYNPWIKLHFHDFHFSPMIMGLREVLDDNYNNNKSVIEKLRTDIIEEIKSDLKNYRSIYKEEIEEEIEVENANEDDLEYTNDEEIEIFNSEIEPVKEKVIINEKIIISSNEKILLQKDSLIYIKASALKVGDYMLRNSDISELYKSTDLYDKLVNYPQGVLNYQNRLFKKENVHNVLINKGLSIETQYHFKNKYLIETHLSKPSIIPKRKKDWGIICEFLNINHSDQQLSFIAYYGRSNQNELKLMYKEIIELLIENNWIGTIEDSLILNSVSKIVSHHNSIFKTTDSTEIREISESIITTILNQLTLTEVKTIRNE